MRQHPATAIDDATHRAAYALLDEFLAAYNARDAQRWAATLHYPHVRLAGNEVMIW